MAKSQEEQYSEFSKKFNALLTQFREQNKDITVLKDILQKQLEYDTTLAGQRTPRARAEKRDKLVTDKKQEKFMGEQQKLFKKMNKNIDSLDKNMDKFVKSENSRAKIFGKTLGEGLKEDLKDVLSPLLSIGDLPFVRSIKDATVAAFKGQKDLGDKSKQQLESSQNSNKFLDSMEQMTADIRDMLTDIHSHFVGGPSPSEKREMELEKARAKREQDQLAMSKSKKKGDDSGGDDGEGTFDVEEVVELGLGVALGKMIGGIFGAMAGGVGLAGIAVVLGKVLLVGAVAAAAFALGNFIYEKLFGQYFENQRKEVEGRRNKNIASTGGQSMIDTGGGKMELAFQDSEGNVFGETEAKKRMDEGQEGIKPVMFRKRKESGEMVHGEEVVSQKGATKIKEHKAAKKQAMENIKEDVTDTDAQQLLGLEARFKSREQVISQLLKFYEGGKNEINDGILMRMFQAVNDEHKTIIDEVHGSSFENPHARNRGVAATEEGLALYEEAISKFPILKTIYEDFPMSRMQLGHWSPSSHIDADTISSGGASLFFHTNDHGWVTNASGDRLGGYSAYPELQTKALAKGGLVSGPINALVGEAGPELVMPLRDSASVIGKALVEAQRQAPLLGVIPQFGPMGGMPDDLGLNALLKGGALGSPASGQGGQQIIAPSFSNPITNSTVVNNINNGLPDHPAFMQERMDRRDSFLWA